MTLTVLSGGAEQARTFGNSQITQDIRRHFYTLYLRSAPQASEERTAGEREEHREGAYDQQPRMYNPLVALGALGERAKEYHRCQSELECKQDR